MRVFVTGATGYIGGAVTAALSEAGHQVTGLVRSDSSARRLQGLGGQALLGDIHDPGSYDHVLAGQDTMIHLAADYAAGTVEADRATAETLLAAGRAGDGERAIIYTSGCWVLGDTGDEAAGEDAPTRPAEIVAWRPQHEQLVLDAATDHLATVVIRPGVVYGGPGGLTARFFESAVEEGASEYVGDGENRWTMVHRDDLARLYALAVEKRARGVLHGVDGAPFKLKEIATAASEASGAGGAVRSLDLKAAREKLGGVADALCLDQAIAAPRALALGWRPERPAFPESAPAAFAEWKKTTG